MYPIEKTLETAAAAPLYVNIVFSSSKNQYTKFKGKQME